MNTYISTKFTFRQMESYSKARKTYLLLIDELLVVGHVAMAV
jgi:hypothetical protein